MRAGFGIGAGLALLLAATVAASAPAARPKAAAPDIGLMEVQMTAAAWLPDSRTVITSGNRGLFVWDAVSGTVTKRVDLPRFATAAKIYAWPDGRHIEVTLDPIYGAPFPELCHGCRDGVDHNVYVLDLRTGAWMPLRDRMGQAASLPLAPISSPDGARTLAPDADGHLFVTSSDGSQSVALSELELPRLGISGGEDADQGDAPWQVEIIWAGYQQPHWLTNNHPDRPKTVTDYHHCGGSLIAADWVLTAAHCVTGEDGKALDPTQLQVRAGSESLLGAMRVFDIDRFVVREDFAPSTFHQPPRNDLALVHITPPAPLDLDNRARIYRSGGGWVGYERQRIGLIPLAETAAPPRQFVTVTGWGATKPVTLTAEIQSEAANGFQQMDPQLQKGRLQVAADGDCAAQITSIDPEAKLAPLAPTLFCAGSPSGPATCQGDSGGPLVGLDSRRNPVLVGVVGWAPGCNQAPGVYTSVAPFRRWIDQKIADGGK